VKDLIDNNNGAGEVLKKKRKKRSKKKKTVVHDDSDSDDEDNGDAAVAATTVATIKAPQTSLGTFSILSPSLQRTSPYRIHNHTAECSEFSNLLS
jgi:hypothetical protein